MLVKFVFFIFSFTKCYNFLSIFIYSYIQIYISLCLNFSVKSAFQNKFMASLLLIPLIIQQESTPFMFKTAISSRFVDIINKS